MQSLGDSAYSRLRKIADDRDITVQELIRAIVIPDWLKSAENSDDRGNLSAKRQLEKRRKRMSRSNARGQLGEFAVASRPKRKP
ncbi:MAG TPA: hypothetical protein VFE96_02150 [Candidatus Bathyarchaeia archaeon]|jgi:predicted DNA-binding ribbon-helix-helix protein|nr:hypothetical protein [Candidatus Bathyarchaeia archaeon]